MVLPHFLVGLRATLLLTVLTGLLYPLAVTATAQFAFGDKADGSLITKDGHVVGSRLLRQEFTSERYFHPRPSAAGATAAGRFVDVTDDAGNPTGEAVPGDAVPGDAEDVSLASSSGSNKGPTNEEWLDTVAERVAAYRQLNDLGPGAAVPVDAVTASASGLDPDISVANARIQARRVARVRGVDTDTVFELVGRHTRRRFLGILGEDGVNVLQLNLALDGLTGGRT